MAMTATPAAPSLLPGEDTGASDSDGVIKLNGPMLVGQTAPFAVITLYDNAIMTTVFSGNTSAATATADANGFYSIYPFPVLDDGKHSLTITAQAPGQAASLFSPPLAIVVDTSAPDAPTAPVLTAAFDTGISSLDGITDKNILQLTGTTEPGAVVALYNGTDANDDGKDDSSDQILVPLQTVTSGADGSYSFTTSALADGVYNFTVKAMDLAGNVSKRSASTSITVDTAAPAAPPAPTLSPGSDTGASHSDGLTDDATPVVIGTAEANSTVLLYDDGMQIAKAQANASGTYAITAPKLDDGAHTLTVAAQDAAGNTSAASAALNVVVDTAPTTATITPSPAMQGAVSLTFTVDFSAVVGDLTARDFTLVATGSASGSVQSVSGSGSVYTVTVDGVSGEGTVGLAFAGTAVTDAAGNPVSVSQNTSQTVAGPITPNTVLVSASATGVAGTGVNGSPSASGRVVAFNSVDGALVPSGATNGTNNVFVKDIQTGAIILVSQGMDGQPANGASFDASLSADGTKVAFASEATNLVAGGTAAGETNIYVATLTEGAGGPALTDIELVSEGNGLQGEGVNGDGSQAESAPILSSDGSTVVFDSTQPLVAGAETGIENAFSGIEDTVENVYAENVASGVITLVSGGTGTDEYGYGIYTDPITGMEFEALLPQPDRAAGTGGDLGSDVTSISANGQLIGYESDATDLGGAPIDIGPAGITAPSRGYVYDSATGTTTALDGTAILDPAALADTNNIQTYAPTLSGNGSTVFFEVHSVVGLTFQRQELYAENLATGVITPVAVSDASDNNEIYVSAQSASKGGGLVLYQNNPDYFDDQAAYQIVLDNPATGTLTQEPGGYQPVLTTSGNAFTFTEEPNGAESDELYETNLGVSAGINTIGTDDTVGPTALAQAVAAGGLAVSGTTNAPAGATVLVQLYGASASTNTLNGPAVTGTADGAGHWSATVPVGLLQTGDGPYALVAQIGTTAGSSFYSVRDFTVDTQVPAAPDAPKLDAGSDTSVAGDGSATNQDTPVITGTAEAGSTVTLYDTTSATPNTALGTAVADSSGIYAITTPLLLDGKHILDVTATDAAGNVSAASDGLTITVDTVVPDTPDAPALQPASTTSEPFAGTSLDQDITTTVAASDTGKSATDGITSNATPVLVGVAEAKTTVTLYDTDGKAVLGTATVGADGKYAITSGSLSDGTHMLTVTDTDAAGNVSHASATLAVTIDTLPPLQPTITSITGALVSGRIPPLVTVSGTAEPGSTVKLVLDGGMTAASIFGESTAASDGDYSINSDYLPAGDGQNLSVMATDVAGNDSQPSLPADVNIASSATPPPGTPPFTPTLLGLLTDGPISDATVFADANGNGTLDAGEAGARTGADGSFTLYGPSGELVATGGIDSTTGLTNTLTLTAPAGSTVIDPLTTLLDAYAALTGADPRAVQPQFLAALGLPTTIDLTTLDPNAALLAGDGLPEVLGAKVMDTLTEFQAYLAGNGVTESDGFAAGFTAIAQAIASVAAVPDQVIDLDSSSTLKSIFLAAAGPAVDPSNPFGNPIGNNAGVVTTVATAGNMSLSTDLQTGGSGLAAAVAATQLAFQGAAATALRGVGTSAGIAAEVAGLYTTGLTPSDVGLIDGPPRLASDTGQSGTDQVIDTEEPTFVGTALPGTEVALFESYNGVSFTSGYTNVTVIGVATADAFGHYSITPVALDTYTNLTPTDSTGIYLVGAYGSAPTQSNTFSVGENLVVPDGTPAIQVEVDPAVIVQPTITDATVAAAPGDDSGQAAVYVWGTLPYFNQVADDEGGTINIYADGNPVPVATSSTAITYNTPTETVNNAFFGLTTAPLSVGKHVLTVTDTLAGGTVVQGTGSYTVTVPIPSLTTGAASASGTIEGARVYDTGGTLKQIAVVNAGTYQTTYSDVPTLIQSAQPVDTVESTTGAGGGYQIAATPGSANGLVAATGGWDTLTGLPLGGAFAQMNFPYVNTQLLLNTGSLLAPAGSTAISPLTSVEALLNGGSVGAAKATLAAFGLPANLDLETLDPIAAAKAGDVRPFLVDAELLDTVTMLAPFTGFSFAAIAYYVGENGTLNLASVADVTAMLTTYFPNLSHLAMSSIPALAAIIADSNEAIESEAATAVSLADTLSYTLAAETVAQEGTTAALEAAVVGPNAFKTNPVADITAAAAAFTGASLTTAIAAARAGSAQATGFVAAGPLSTPASNVDFTISFGTSVSGLTTADFATVTGGDLTGTQVTTVTPIAGSNGSAYDVSVATGAGSGSLAVSFQPGASLLTGSFSAVSNALLEPEQSVADAGGEALDVAVGDLNGDGRPDAVLLTQDYGGSFHLTVLTNQGSGAFVAGAPMLSDPGNYGALSIGDFNGDGKPDIITISDTVLPLGDEGAPTAQLQVVVLPGNGDGTFGTAITTDTSLPASDLGGAGDTYGQTLAVGDFNHDGRLDLAIAGNGSLDGYYGYTPGDTVNIMLGNGDGTFHAGQGLDTSTDGIQNDRSSVVATADLNNDGNLDIVALNPNQDVVDIYLGNGDGTFRDAPSLQDQGFPEDLAVGDVNGDGNQDIVVLDGTSLEVFLGKGDGTFTALTPLALPPVLDGLSNGPHSIALADINGDGRLDVVLNGQYGTQVLEGNGDGTFTPAYSSSDAAAGGVFAVADVNGDGRPDVLVPVSEDAESVQDGSPLGLDVLLNTPQTVVGSTSPSVTIDRPVLAVPALAKASGAGTLTSVGNAYTLDLGTLSQGGAAAVALALDNTAAAPADSFDGLFSSPSGSGFTVTGAALAQAVAAGGSYGGLGVAADTSTPGSYSETITFAPRDVTAPVTTSVTVGDPADGDTTADATPNPDAVAKELSPITLTVTDTVVASGAPIAPAALAPVAPVVLPNVRVGAADSAALALTNAATAPAAGLDVTAVASGAASVSGAITGLTPGGTDSSDIVAGISTESAGALTGTVTLSPVSDASGVTTPLAAVGVTVSGSVFRPAAAQVAAVTAILHVGDAGTVALPVGNSDPADGFSENLIAAIASVTPGLTIAAGGPSADIAPGATDQSLTVTVSTAAAGTVSGTATLSLTSDGGSAGSGPDGLGALALAAATVPITATVDNDAQATLVATGATLTGSAASGYILDLGAVQQGSAAVSATLDTVNSAAGPADALAGSYAVATGVGLTDSGFAAFSGDGAGQADAGGSVTLQTGQVGAFSQTIVLHTTGSNASGYSAALADQTVTVEGTVVAAGTAVGSIATTPASLGVVPGAAATAIGITAPTDTAFDAGQLTITIGALPTDGTVMLADGTAVVAGEGLSALQLAGLHFIPAAGAAGVSSALTYAVSDPSGSTASGTATLAVLTAGSATAPQPPTLLLASPPGGPEAASPAAAKAISNDPTPPVVGVAADGAQVTLTTGGVAAGGSTADASTGAYGAALTTSLGLGVSAVTATAANSAGTSAASAPVSVYEIPVPVAGVSAPDISSVDVGALFDQGYRLQFAGGTEAAALVDGTVSVGPDTNEAYLQRLYEGLFGRSNDAAGMEFWDNLLTVGVAQYAIAADFMTTPEYRATFPDQAQQTDSQFVGQLYHGFLGRAPTAGDQAYWGGVADRYGRQYVLADVADSAEAKTALASTTAQVWGRSTDGTLVHELYETGLDREVELSGLAFWKNTLESNALTPLALAQTISTRPEFVALHAGQSDTSYVASLYEAGFGRAPDAAGAAFWGGLLAAGTLTRAGVLLGIATSGEAVADQTRNL